MVQTTVVAEFPPGYFLENIAAAHDGGLYITCANRQELYYVLPSPEGREKTFLIHTFAPDQWTMGIVDAPTTPGVFYLLTSDLLGQGSCTSYLHVVDTTNAATGSRPQRILTFPAEAKGLNGLCALSEHVLLAADSFASCIWRIDLDSSHSPPRAGLARVWFSDPTMEGRLVLPDFQPGTNGMKFSKVTGYAYFSSTQKKLFCQVRVNAETLEAEGRVHVLAEGMQGDDFIIDDVSAAGPYAYLTTHRDNTILRIKLNRKEEEERRGEVVEIVRGSDQVEEMLGPTAGAWAPSSVGKAAYFTTDGGLKNPPSDGRPRIASIVKVDF